MKRTVMFRKLLVLIAIFTATNTRAQWSIICNSGNGFVDNFEIYNNELYAAGFFTSLCGTPYNYISKWNGVSLQSAGNGFDEAVHHLSAIGNDLYAVRYEPAIDSNWLYKYDGNDFNKFGEGIYLTNAVVGFSKTPSLYNVIQYNNELIVCGEFNRAGNKLISGIMKWNGSEWDSLSSGLSGNIPNTAPVMYPHDLCLLGNDLIVCGNFRNAGGEIVNGIARWDGVQWYAMGAGFNSTVYGICVYDGELYAGGDFTMSGTSALKYIAKWDGTNWVDPGFRLFYNNVNDYSFIHTLKVLDNKLFIGGGFDRAVFGTDTMLCAAVAAYDGISIDTLQGGLPGNEVEALAFYDGKLFAGGGLSGSSLIGSYDFTTSVSEIYNEEKSVAVFPNPSTGKINISADEIIDEINISNIIGQKIYHSAVNDKFFSLSLNADGVYFVSVKKGKKSIMKKVVVSKD